MKTATAPKAVEKDLTPVILTADTLMALVERVGALERDNADLRKLITKNHDECADNLQKSLDSVYSQCIPDLMEDGRLRSHLFLGPITPDLFEQVIRLREALETVADQAHRASLVQDRSVHIIKQACAFIAKGARAALQPKGNEPSTTNK